ncbi:D-alanine--D-alanine ligase [Nakamurella silvestris]|nr:D-alanine--D-alanine ligase [Nakamurella silvestris]
MKTTEHPHRRRVAVIGGGENCEHEVSLSSAASVRTGLEPRYEVTSLTIGLDGIWCNDAGRPLGSSRVSSVARATEVLGGADVVFPVVHGPRGEDGTLSAYLDLLGLPAIGTGTRGGAIAMDKWATKVIAEAVGIRTAPGRLLTSTESAEAVTWTGPVVVKPVAAGSSHGVTLVHEPSGLSAAVELARTLDDRVLIEELLVGREIDIAVLRTADGEVRVSAPLEISNVTGGVFGTEQKYDGTASFRVPADLAEAEVATISAAARSIFHTLGCDGVARCDFFLTDDGLVLNEVNTMPGMTAHSQVPKMFAAVGLSYPDLLDELVRAALTR